MSRFFVYGLFDTRRPEAIRYVGAASVDSRPLQHQTEARQRWARKTHKLDWIRSLPSPYGWRVLRECGSWDETVAAEKEIIATLRAKGADLTNGTGGGEGVYNPTPEVKAKCSAALRIIKGSPAQRAVHRALTKEMRARPEIKAKYAKTLSSADYHERRSAIAARINTDPEVRQKMDEAHRRSWEDPDVRARRVAGMKASWDRRRKVATK